MSLNVSLARTRWSRQHCRPVDEYLWSVSAELTGLVLQAQLSSSGSSSRHHTSMGFGLVSISTSFAGLDIKSDKFSSRLVGDCAVVYSVCWQTSHLLVCVCVCVRACVRACVCVCKHQRLHRLARNLNKFYDVALRRCL